MAPRILILSSSVGGGHMRAAEAIELAVRQRRPDAIVKNVDVLRFTNRFFRAFYATSYLYMVDHAPHVYGYFYDKFDSAKSAGRTSGDRLRLFLERLNLRRIVRLLRATPWDLAICTHFLPAGLIASMREMKKIDLQLATAITDFDAHRMWVNQPCERYFTINEETALCLQHWGVPAGDISLTGIPIHPDFALAKDRDECLDKHGLARDRPIVLQLAGSWGVGPVEKMYRQILTVEVPIQVVVVCGRNARLRTELEKIAPPAPHRAKIYGFTHDIDELMVAADLVVSKPGGLTTAEALATNTVMVIFNPTPGQEDRNSDFLLENGAAVKVNLLAALAHKISSLLNDKGRLERMRENIRHLGRPQAAANVVRQSLRLLAQPELPIRSVKSEGLGGAARDP